jgi:protein-arginine kinase
MNHLLESAKTVEKRSGPARQVPYSCNVALAHNVVKRGKTPVLSAAEARQLLDTIESNTLIELRDRR